MKNRTFYELGEESFKQGNYEGAVQFYIEGTEHGEADCINALGYCYDEGIGVKEDKKKAIELYSKAAGIGHGKAQRNLGLSYQIGNEHLNKDEKLAFIWLKQAALNGIEDCIWKVAKRYYDGRGTKRNLTKAIEWFEKSVQTGNAYAALTLAKLYNYEDDFENDQEMAIKWYKKASEMGLAEAQNHYGFYLAQKEKYEEAFYWYQQAANQDYKEAIANLGYCYLYGRGVKKDKEKARDLLENCLLDYLYISDELYEDDFDEEYD